MDGDPDRKKENRQRMYTTAEWRLEARIREAMREIKGADGKPPSRAIARVVYDEQKPVGMLGRRMVEMRRKRVPLKSVERMIDELRDWLVNDLYGAKQTTRDDRVA